MNKSFIVGLIGLVVTAGAVRAGDWTENVKVKGDLRYRHELIDKENVDDRTRHRIRARLGIEGKVNDQTTAYVQLATGSDDPVSTNQTLGSAFSSKSVVLDLAYIQFRPKQVSGLTIWAGKSKLPFIKPGKSELLWDSDLNPEGVSGMMTVGENDLTLKLVGSGLWIEERSKDDESYMLAGQAAISQKINDIGGHITGGVGYFHYGNIAGWEPLYDDDPFGNSVMTVGTGDDAASVFMYEYRLLELFGEVAFKAGDVPITVIGDYVTNSEPDDNNTGWLAGAYIGKTKKPGSLAARYIYRNVEKDATFGLFSDSDFIGGGTDGKGHEFGVDLQVADRTTFSVSYFDNKIGLDDEQGFKRVQVDAQLKF